MVALLVPRYCTITNFCCVAHTKKVQSESGLQSPTRQHSQVLQLLHVLPENTFPFASPLTMYSRLSQYYDLTCN